MQMTPNHEHFMAQALELAMAAEKQGEVPVGALVVSYADPTKPEVVGRGLNLKETAKSAIRHAEIIALEEASAKLGRWRLNDCTLYVTLEPCAMCAGALVSARLGALVYGARDPKAGAVDSLFQIPTDIRLNHRLTVVSGVMAEECGGVLTEFFRRKRQQVTK